MLEHKPQFSTDDVGQHGHDVGTRHTSFIGSAELKAAHAKQAKQSQIDEYDSSDQADSREDAAKRTRESDDVRADDQDNFNSNEATFVTPQANDNVCGTKSGAPSNNGQKLSGGGR
jgi:hypothetical protein